MLDRLKNLFARKPGPAAAPEPAPHAGGFLFPELWDKLEAGAYDDVKRAAAPLLASRRPAEVQEANRLIAHVYFKQGMYAESVPYFESAARDSRRTNDWFNITTSATLAGMIEKGAEACAKAIQCQIDSGHTGYPTIPFMRMYYACALRDAGEFRRGMEQIEALRPIYEQLHITDTTFLYMRGVPFLSHTMKVAVDILNGLGAEIDARAWLDAFADKVDEEGQELLKEAAAGLQAGG